MNVEWSDALTGGDVPVMRSPAELSDLYRLAGATPDKEVVTYCQTGQRGSHTYFVLRLLGYPKVRMYDGSWQEWGNDPSVPVEK